MPQTKRALAGAWVGLVLITLLSFAIADSSEISRDLVTVIVIAAAAIKGAIVLVQFMGVRAFPIGWQIFFGLWLAINSAMIVGFHLAS